MLSYSLPSYNCTCNVPSGNHWDGMIVYFQRKCWSGVARVHIFIGIFLLIVHWGYHSMTYNVSEQKQGRNRPVPSQLSFIMRCLKSWQQTAGVNLESKKRKDFPPVFTHPNPPQISQTLTSLFGLTRTCSLCLSITIIFVLCCALTSLLFFSVSDCSIDRAACLSLSSVKDLRSTGCFWEDNCFPWVSFVRWSKLQVTGYYTTAHFVAME